MTEPINGLVCPVTITGLNVCTYLEKLITPIKAVNLFCFMMRDLNNLWSLFALQITGILMY